MISKTIQRKIASGQIILYRRVSTQAQAGTGYADQLDTVKLFYPDFSIVQSTIYDVKEVMSGLKDAEVRMASGLGKVQRHLKRNPGAIVLVSDANRIARRPDVFELIKAQGLGHRIFDASTGMSVNDVIKNGAHIAIAKQTKAQEKSRLKGMKRYIQNGGEMGYDGISSQSSKGTATKKQLALEREEAVLNTVSQMTFHSRGQAVAYADICNELDRREVRTGQGRPFSPERLAQLRKKNPDRWKRPCDSYHRPRRRIRHLVKRTQLEYRMRRRRQLRMKRLLDATTYKLIWSNLTQRRDWRMQKPWQCWNYHAFSTNKYLRRNGVPP